MELREWAMRVFSADCLEEKLLPPPEGVKALTDHKPGAPMAWKKPPRPAGLKVAPKAERKKFPKAQSLYQKDMRLRCLHAFANHELMALELMAWALLAFPQADGSFRKGLAGILADEQRHFKLYSDHLKTMGTHFGDLPLNDHFWRAAVDIKDPLDWVCTMHLTFEQANLDHAPFYAKLFREAGDEASAQLMQIIFDDELGHVGFGSHWLQQLKPAKSSMFETYEARCTEWTPPNRAIGPEFQTQARRQAGLDEDFIRSLQNWHRR